MPKKDGKAAPTLFLCWSGPRSKQVAEALGEYFESVFRTLKWSESRAKVAMSETLIDKGAPWSTHLLKDLENARAGIVCLTPENRGSAWLHFEGGAIATHGLDKPARSSKSTDSRNKLFGFLFTFDNTQMDGPLSLYQATMYRRDYGRDWDELGRLTHAVLRQFAKRGGEAYKRKLPADALEILLGRLRELQYVAFRDFIPLLEASARRIIQAAEDLRTIPGRVQTLSAILALQHLLEDRSRQAELICAAGQQMFLERLIESLSVARRAIEVAIGGAQTEVTRVKEAMNRLRRMLEVAIEELTPVLDDAWRYALYGTQGDRKQAFRKQKLLLVQPLESKLQRAELATLPKPAEKPSDEGVPAGHLLSRNEKRRALRSYWAWDRIAAYIHYCEDVGRPTKGEMKRVLIDLTRGVLKEIALADVRLNEGSATETDNLPLRYALRALVLKVKLAIDHGRYGEKDEGRILKKSVVRGVIELRIKGETGLSFDGIEEFLDGIDDLDSRIDPERSKEFRPPLPTLIDDLRRILNIGAKQSDSADERVEDPDSEWRHAPRARRIRTRRSLSASRQVGSAGKPV